MNTITMVVENGTKYWYRDGLLHREDGPAIECPSGTKFWYRNGDLHREDGPAVERADGTKFWYRNGQLLKVEDKQDAKRWHAAEQYLKALLKDGCSLKDAANQVNEAFACYTGKPKTDNKTSLWHAAKRITLTLANDRKFRIMRDGSNTENCWVAYYTGDSAFAGFVYSGSSYDELTKLAFSDYLDQCGPGPETGGISRPDARGYVDIKPNGITKQQKIDIKTLAGEGSTAEAIAKAVGVSVEQVKAVRGW
jgi:hypothetical protein